MSDGTRVAYVITSYVLPGQVLRLASVLRAGSAGAHIVVHHDDRRCSLDRAALAALDVRLVEPPTRVAWGEFSQLAMVLRCVRWALANTDFAWLVLLSGQDYPVRPVAEIEHDLVVAGADALIETHPCERPRRNAPADEFAERYYCRWRRVAGAGAPVARALAGRGLGRGREMPSGTWFGVPALRSPFGDGFVCQRGADWFTLSRAAAEAVDRFVDARRDVVRYYRRTLIPTESFVHTVVANDPSLRVSGDHGRYSVRDRPRMSRPRVLGTGDVDAMLASGARFARKFDETVDRAVLDEIDRRVHARG